MKKFELTFEGAAIARCFPRYRRWHPTIDSATAEADRVYERLAAKGLPTVCHRFEVLDEHCVIVAA